MGLVNLLSRMRVAGDDEQREPPKPSYILAYGDTHHGYVAGLMPPDVVLIADDAVTEIRPELNILQNYLYYDVFRPGIEHIKNKVSGCRVIALHNGDIGHGARFISDMVVPSQPAAQVDIAIDSIEEVLEIQEIEQYWMVVGTHAHNMGQGSIEHLILKQMRLKSNSVAFNTVFHGLGYIDNMPIDFTHHGPYHGSREWLKGDAVRRYVRDTIEQCVTHGLEVPKLMLRAHYHVPVVERVNHLGHDVVIVITPPFCFPNEWTKYKAKNIFTAANGFALIEIYNEKVLDVDTDTIKYVDLRTKVRLLRKN